MMEKSRIQIAAAIILPFSIFIFLLYSGIASLLDSSAQNSSNPLVRHIVYQRAKAQRKVLTTTLNQNTPVFDELVGFMLDADTAWLRRFPIYTDYYSQVIKLMPTQAEGYLLLGYCLNAQGENLQAAAVFKKSSELNPNLFWPYYNLGVIFFKQEEYPLAGQFFSRAMQVKPETALKLMSASTVYRQIIQAHPALVQDMGLRLKEAYESAFVGLVQSLKNANQREAAQALLEKRNLSWDDFRKLSKQLPPLAARVL